MESQTLARLSMHAEIIKALAHPTRLFIVHELNREERCVCQLTELIGSDMSTVSRHLSVLKTAGIVADDRRGNQVWYSLKVPCVLNFLGCVEAVLNASAREKLSMSVGS